MPIASFCAISGVAGLVVAVGEGGRILHFSGDLYRPYEPGSPTRAPLRGVAVLSPSDAWAVGDDGIFHWDGRAWKRMAMAMEEGYRAVWADVDSGVWIGGRRSLLNYRGPGHGGMLVHSDTPIRAVWGTGPRDVWFLAEGRTLLHWDGMGCAAESLPGDDDEEWTALAGGGPDEPVYVVGPSGFCLEYSRQTGKWWELSTDTPDLITGAVSDGADSLWVCTASGQVQHWDGIGWQQAAFNAFGPLHGLAMVDGCIWACGAGGVVLQHLPEDGGAKE